MSDTSTGMIETGVDYETGPLAITDLHAGGIFFCVVYKEVLCFEPDGTVRRSCRLIDESRSLDEDWVRRGQRAETGTYSTNDRGYLVLNFPEAEFTGLPCQKAADLLAFHVVHRNTRSHGLVYRRVGGSTP